jgi:hypothetical protein
VILWAYWPLSAQIFQHPSFDVQGQSSQTLILHNPLYCWQYSCHSVEEQLLSLLQQLWNVFLLQCFDRVSIVYVPVHVKCMLFIHDSWQDRYLLDRWLVSPTAKQLHSCPRYLVLHLFHRALWVKYILSLALNCQHFFKTFLKQTATCFHASVSTHTRGLSRAVAVSLTVRRISSREICHQ